MKRPLWLLAVAVLVGSLAGVNAASAQITGTFAFTNSDDCIVIVPPATFNSAFEPTAGPVFRSTSNNLGIVTFNANGTGNVQILLGVGTFAPVPPGTFSSTNSSASSWKSSHQFTYTVSGGIILTALVSGSYSQTFQSGPRAGQTAMQDVLSNAAYISMDGYSYLSMSDATQVETKTYSNGDVRPEVCTRASRGFKP
jgi:hypothetical protein